MDRLLAVPAFLISQRSFREECMSEAAPASRGGVWAFCAIGAPVVPRVSDRSGRM